MSQYDMRQDMRQNDLSKILMKKFYLTTSLFRNLKIIFASKANRQMLRWASLFKCKIPLGIKSW
jgi:hypothetical protein